MRDRSTSDAEGAGRKAGAQPSGSCSPRGSAILAPPEHRPWGAPWPPSWAGGEASVWGRGRGRREGVWVGGSASSAFIWNWESCKSFTKGKLSSLASALTGLVVLEYGL